MTTTYKNVGAALYTSYGDVPFAMALHESTAESTVAMLNKVESMRDEVEDLKETNASLRGTIARLEADVRTAKAGQRQFQDMLSVSSDNLTKLTAERDRHKRLSTIFKAERDSARQQLGDVRNSNHKLGRSNQLLRNRIRKLEVQPTTAAVTNLAEANARLEERVNRQAAILRDVNAAFNKERP